MITTLSKTKHTAVPDYNTIKLSGMKNIRIVHVDDSNVERKIVSVLAEQYENAELLGGFSDAETALEFILQNDVDLVIIDIELPGKDGFWLADQLKNVKTEVVFLTAYSEYSLKAFEACAIHYVLKPMTKEKLSEILRRYDKIREGAEERSNMYNEQITELVKLYFNKTPYPRRIFINNIHRTIVLNLDEVVSILSSGPYTIFKTIDGGRYTASKLLKTYDEVLKNHPDFVRIHRAHIINKNFVKAVIRDKHKIYFSMTDGDQLEVSPQKRMDIYNLINK
jgi:two-component system LytT family response regulator